MKFLLDQKHEKFDKVFRFTIATTLIPTDSAEATVSILPPRANRYSLNYFVKSPNPSHVRPYYPPASHTLHISLGRELSSSLPCSPLCLPRVSRGMKRGILTRPSGRLTTA